MYPPISHSNNRHALISYSTSAMSTKTF